MKIYEQTSKRGQIARLRRAIQSAMAPMDFKSCRSIQHQHNSSFALVTALGERRFLRVSRSSDRSADAIQDEVQWLHELAQNGMPVARPIPRDDGTWVTSLAGDLGEDRFLTCFEWREGRRTSRPTPAQWHILGQVMAQMHEHSMGRDDLGLHRWEVDGLLGNRPTSEESLAEVEMELGPEARLELESVYRRYLELRPQLGPPQLIHGDLHQWNVLFTRDDALTVIDFDDCGRAPALYDLVVPLAEMSQEEEALAKPALLEGYRSIRPIPGDLDAALPVLKDLRSAQLVLWLVGERHNPSFADSWESESRELLARIPGQR